MTSPKGSLHSPPAHVTPGPGKTTAATSMSEVPFLICTIQESPTFQMSGVIPRFSAGPSPGKKDLCLCVGDTVQFHSALLGPLHGNAVPRQCILS